MSKFSRREFLRLTGLAFASLSFPAFPFPYPNSPHVGPSHAREQLPEPLGEILARVPEFLIDQDGYLHLVGSDGVPLGRVRQTQTLWNIEHSTDLDLLDVEKPWAIVLHWFGDEDDFADGLSGYLRGFNTERRVEDYGALTSAHFLIGDANPESEFANPTGEIGVIQTQKPYRDGTPTFASHLKFLDYESHRSRQQYFVRALYQLSFENPSIQSILQTWFDGPRLDPNRVTIALEITGTEFDLPAHQPSTQKTANVVGMIWALMKHYGIPIYDVLGHSEIDLKKSDPGKKFMALIRLLIGLKAWLSDDVQMEALVFGPPGEDGTGHSARVENFFAFVRDYLMLASRPVEVYDWEAYSGYWFAMDQVVGSQSSANPVRRVEYPGLLTNRVISPYDPRIREGIDVAATGSPLAKGNLVARLFAEGLCLHVNPEPRNNQPRLAMFRHRLWSGAEVVSMYSQLSEVQDLEVGEIYPRSTQVGHSLRELDFLPPRYRFAILYAAAWDTEFKDRPYVPPGVNSGWIEERFLDPVEFLKQQNLLTHFIRR